MSDQDNNDHAADSLIHQHNFGSCFRVAREAAGLSIYEVADQLKLTKEIINALENSQIDALPASTFTQGYIRSYAKLLNLPADDIISTYTLLLPETENPLSVHQALPSQKTSRDSSVKLVTYSLLFMGFILLIIWWYQTDFDWIENGEASKNKTEAIQQQEPHQAISMEVDKILLDENKQQDQFEIKQTVKQNKQVNYATLSMAAAKNEDDKLAALTDVSAPSGEDVLLLSTTADSWIEVEDENNHRLFFELIEKDKIQQLKGKAPFRVFLGNAPAVDIQLNNRSIDMSVHIRKNNIAHIAIYKDGSVVNVRRQKKSADKDEIQSDVDKIALDIN